MQMLSDANKQIDEGFKTHSKLELRINDLRATIQELSETADEQRRVILNLTNERDGFREETKELSKEKKEMFSRFMLQSGQWREKMTQLTQTCKQQQEVATDLQNQLVEAVTKLKSTTEERDLLKKTAGKMLAKMGKN